ncbi:MAG TPA: Ada metal-binding domain-containing protein [Candidatus Pacearchaeota archaeon]|nr:Ada metal-binding domain-containing protein [Candidatus Pacearchaeota archaeon]HPZ74517.1 Ada metal-binding domain-containing protein [Candidatus Pacearchaeota archaeon]HQD89118.1 Ada metal-binding domain-containing protein [Candidatus Pacearchaeota archaeon]
MISEIKKFFKDNEADIVLVIGVILISLVSFGSGWLLGNNSVLSSDAATQESIIIEDQKAVLTENLNLEALSIEKTESENETTAKIEENQQIEEVKPETSNIVASKNGTVYHYVWCSGAKRIKEENKIYFNSIEEAEKAGYRPAKNCPGLGEE